MKLTSLSTTTKSAIRKKKTASENMIYHVKDGAESLVYRYKKGDTNKDNGHEVLVSTKGLVFRLQKNLEDAPIPEKKPDDKPEEKPDPVPSNGKKVEGFNTHTAKGTIEAGSDLLSLDSDMKLAAGDSIAVFNGIDPLLAEVVEVISPLKVRLNKPAEVTLKEAKVVVDCTNVMVEYIRYKKEKTFDAAKLGFGKNDTLYFRRVKWEGYWWIDGIQTFPTDITIDFGAATYASIPGAFPVSFGVEHGASPGNFITKGGILIQNGTDKELGEKWRRELNVDNEWLYAPAVGMWTRGARAENVTVVNPCAYAFWGDGDVINCHAYNTKDGLKFYNGFWFLTFGGKIIGCSAKSEYLVRVLEIEAGNGGLVENFKAVNGIAASNSSWNAVFRNLDFTFTKGAAQLNPSLLANPVFEIHDHIKGSAYNILAEDITITYEDYLDDVSGTLRGIVVKGENTKNVTLRRIKINHPSAPVKHLRGNGAATSLRLGADNSVVEDFETNATLWEGFGKEDYLNSHDNTIISVTGKNCILRRVKAKAAVVAQDTIVEDCEFEYGFTRI